MDMEYILCAAIWYKNFTPKKNVGVPLPVNCDKGVVICGHRHTNCIYTMSSITGLRTVERGKDATGDHVQGFLTSKNRFVTREEAAQIALDFGQISQTKRELFSEDLY